MKILQLHCQEVEFQPIKKEIASAEDSSTEKRSITDTVLLLTSVEKNDNATIVPKVISELQKTKSQLGTDSFVLYPYAHLSRDLASPQRAKEILMEIELESKNQGLSIIHVPFGWNKALSMKVKGHPLAEQSKFFEPALSPSSSEAVGSSNAAAVKNEILSAALKAEDTLRSTWFVIDLEGNLIPVEQFDFSKHKNLERLKTYEIQKVRAVQKVPPHVTLMKRLGLVDYEPASDSGNLRYYPKGRFMKSLLERYVTQRVLEYGALEVETPIMYDMEHPALKSYLNRFPARQYLVMSDDKQFFLRFAACFGQFLIAKDLQLSYKQLPLKLYELTRYSFRREKSGELVGLRRLRAFTMPDCHAIVKNMDQAKEEFPVRFKLSQNVLKGIGFDSTKDYELAIRFTEEFYRENKEFIASIIKLHGRPALVEMWKERFFYFVLKWEFNFLDNLDKASALSTDQIDTENAERYGITFVDETGKRRTPLILHNSPSGAIERCIFGLLEKAAREQREGKVPLFPLWLAPSQVRFIPVSGKYLQPAEDLSSLFERAGIRVDVDDREESVGKRIRDAEREWVPYVIIVGEKEAADPSALTVRIRSSEGKKEEAVEAETLVKSIAEQLEGKPWLPLPLPKLLSKRPSFEMSSS